MYKLFVVEVRNTKTFLHPGKFFFGYLIWRNAQRSATLWGLVVPANFSSSQTRKRFFIYFPQETLKGLRRFEVWSVQTFRSRGTRHENVSSHPLWTRNAQRSATLWGLWDALRFNCTVCCFSTLLTFTDSSGCCSSIWLKFIVLWKWYH